MNISVVIPVYNEEKNVEVLHKRLVDVLNKLKVKYEIIFVDDGSTDSTYTTLLELDKIKIIKFRKNFGQSAALAAGFDHAKGEVIITLDGDLQNDPSDIPLLLEKMKDDDLDVVCGWRHMRKDTLPKRIFSRLANKLRNILIRDPVHDSGCTFRVYKKECFDDLKLMGEMHRYIPALLVWKGFSLGEVKVNHHQRKFGKSKYSSARLFKGFLDLFNVWFWRKYSSRPLHIFGGMGLVLAFVGFIFGIVAIYERIYLHLGLTRNFLSFVAVFSVILGAQFFVSGLLGDIAIKNYYRSGNGKTYNIKKIVEK